MTAPRFDIQFMRGVAVLAVVAFHAFPAVFPHGFLGVDVFFVVSGFLITGIILKSVGQPGFFGHFYRRRALRLLPASLTTLAVTTGLAIVFLTKSEMAEYAAQLLGSLAFAANFVLASQSGYFDGVAETKPLLHIWSLSLEEQFYFLAPALLWITPLRARPWLLGAGFVLSLTLCIVLVTGPAWLPVSSKTAANLAFFMLPTRAWELLAGGLCAWLMLNRPDLAVPAWLKYCALAIIPVVCIVGLDPVHPRWDAVIVVLATSVLLLGQDGWLPAVGITRPVWHVGNWSYSLYLIHWPLFAFAFVSWGERPPAGVMIGLAGLSAILAWLQWKFVEQTCRDGLPFRLRAPVVLGGVMSVLAIAAGADLRMTAAAQTSHGSGVACDARGARWADKPECRTSETPLVAVWGDSYAIHLVPGLEGVPLVQLTKTSCAPVDAVAPVSARYTRAWAEECVGFNEDALAAITSMPSVKYVVIGSIWVQLLSDEVSDTVLANGKLRPRMGEGEAALLRAIARLRAAGKTPILVVPTPRADFDAGSCNVRQLEGRPVFGRTRCDIDEAAAKLAGAEVDAALRRVAATTGVELLDPALVLCRAGRCATRLGDRRLYEDRGHLTPDGSRFVMAGLGIKSRFGLS